MQESGPQKLQRVHHLSGWHASCPETIVKMRTQAIKSVWIVIVAALLLHAGVVRALGDCIDGEGSINPAHEADARIHCVDYSYPWIAAVDATQLSNTKKFVQTPLSNGYLHRESISCDLGRFRLNFLAANSFDLSPPGKNSRHLVLSVLTI